MKRTPKFINQYGGDVAASVMHNAVDIKSLTGSGFSCYHADQGNQTVRLRLLHFLPHAVYVMVDGYKYLMFVDHEALYPINVLRCLESLPHVVCNFAFPPIKGGARNMSAESLKARIVAFNTRNVGKARMMIHG